MANENLHRALEDFQGKRDVGITLLVGQRLTNEEAIAAVHTAFLEAMKEVNAAEMRNVQYDADRSVQIRIKWRQPFR